MYRLLEEGKVQEAETEKHRVEQVCFDDIITLIEPPYKFINITSLPIISSFRGQPEQSAKGWVRIGNRTSSGNLAQDIIPPIVSTQS